MNYKISEMPKEQRPYEKCLREGAAALNDSELLAVILKNGTKGKSSLALAEELLRVMAKTPYPGLLGLLHLSVREMTQIQGIGTVKAIQLKCIGELSKRIAVSAAKPMLNYRQPVTIAQYYMEQLRHEEQEQLVCMFFDNAMHLLGEQVLSRGTVNSAVITPREIFIEALRHHAVCIVLIHNHPSGDPSPSSEDLLTTERIFRAGQMLGVQLVDHLIIGDQSYISLREQGLFKGFEH